MGGGKTFGMYKNGGFVSLGRISSEQNVVEQWNPCRVSSALLEISFEMCNKATAQGGGVANMCTTS